jgi:hypothetical protein
MTAAVELRDHDISFASVSGYHMRNLTHASTTSLKSVPVLALTIWYGMIAKVDATGTATQKRLLVVRIFHIAKYPLCPFSEVAQSQRSCEDVEAAL